MKIKTLLLVWFTMSMASAYSQSDAVEDCTSLKTAADSAYKVFEEEQAKDTLQASYSKERMHTSLYTYFEHYSRLINNGCLSKTEQQQAAEILNKDLSQIAQGGAYFFAEKNYEKATENFLFYSNFCRQGRVSKANLKKNSLTTIDYYAAICSVCTDNHQRSIALLKHVIRTAPQKCDDYELKDLYHLLAVEYQKMNDEENLVKVMEAAIKQIPKERELFTTIMANHYIQKDDYGKAAEYVDRLLKKTPKKSSNHPTYVHTKANIFVHQKQYKTAEGIYKEGLNVYPDSELLVEGLGVAYALQAQDLKEANNFETNQEIEQCYKDAAKLLEKCRTLQTERNADAVDQKRVLLYLENIYYNLGMYDELDKVREFYK